MASQFEERRAVPRYRCGDSALVVAPVTQAVQVEDISREGMKLRFAGDVPAEGAELDIRIQLLPDESSFALKAEVRRVEGSTAGVQFTRMNQFSRAALEKYCAQHEESPAE